METTALRINNRLYITSGITELCEVRYIENSFLGYETQHRIGDAHISCFEGIPLTEQLLIDLKFVEIEFILTKRYESSCGKMLIYIMPDGGIFANGVISDIRLDSLHLLQNLYFAMSGEELINKTIKYEISINKSI